MGSGKIEKVRLGRTGLEVTRLCFGTSGLGDMPSTYGYSVDEDRARATVRAILAGPVNFLDTSRNYALGRSEQRIGAVIREEGAGCRRCLDRPTSGVYRLEGQDVSGLGRAALAGVRNRTLGFVFQSFNLLARTTALENVELPLLYAGTGTAERHRRAKEALEHVGLGARLDHHPAQLSGGQQQRVAIARALVNQPRVLLADEPTGALDSATSLDVMALMQELGDGITVVLVTHEPDIARFARRVIVMKDGHVQSDHQQEPLSARAMQQAEAA